MSVLLRSPPSGVSLQRRPELSEYYLRDEQDCVQRLLQQLDLSQQQRQCIVDSARALVETIRAQFNYGHGVQAFLQEYDLSSQEGVVLLCLAEALLRIPDSGTVDELIKDKIGSAKWQEHLGQSDSLLVNAGTWGLMLSGRLVELDKAYQRDLSGLFKTLAARVGEPVIRGAVKEGMRIMGQQFVMGQTIEAACQRAAACDRYLYSFDMLGEAALSRKDADEYFRQYQKAIAHIASQQHHLGSDTSQIHDSASISIKLSALHPRYEMARRQQLKQELIPRVLLLAEQAAQANMGMSIDAEEADRLELGLDVFDALISEPGLQQWHGLGMVVQAYQKRATVLLDYLLQQARKHGRRIMIRLVKGAYWDTEIKRAQEQGLAGYPVFTRKEHTDLSYLLCVQKLLRAGDCVYPQFATHNAHTVAAVRQMVSPGQLFELQRLHGMGEELYQHQVQQEQLICRVYAPVGSHHRLLPYLVRRLLENGANTSFVNRLTDPRQDVQQLVVDPIGQVEANHGSSHPDILLPERIYGQQRLNSRGFNFSDPEQLHNLQQQVQTYISQQWHGGPLLAEEVREARLDNVVSPADLSDTVGSMKQADDAMVSVAYNAAAGASQDWRQRPVAERALMLETMAQLLEHNRAELMCLCVREAGRCFPDALAELREAVDFCRYYAQLARELFSQGRQLPGPSGEYNELGFSGRGIFVCISPWNFPLAIFCGQVAAALVSGNCVLAKPASATPLLAYRAVQLFHEAGIPRAVLQFLPGGGSQLGQALLQHPELSGVAFTGSTQTAAWINQQLAARRGAIVPLVAETGGQNAMIVDSSALPEQVVSDVLRSAFNSAGQRCSALRILFLQQEVAGAIIELLRGAMQELNLGLPQYLETDVGPVISATARETLQQHLLEIKTKCHWCQQLDVPAELNGYYFGPCVVEIDNLSQLPQEVFGPVLHVIRFGAKQLPQVIQQINDSRYGLTLGVHTRIQGKADFIFRQANVGNVYINRNMIGATVGVQPFGGQGLSGTGPKAGGPHYLFRFVNERTLTINTAAIGGDTGLLNLGDGGRG